MKKRIIVCDKFDPEGVQRLKSHASLEVIDQGGFKRDELYGHLAGAHGLIVRSATKVDAELMEKAPELQLVIRAGVGVDNIDILEASRRGVIVMNAPGGNTVSTAEQAIALLFALARLTPQANASMKSGKWEKSKFKGVELTGKTIGVVGLGRIGKEVVKRARGLQMKVLGFDPFIPRENLAHLEIELVEVDDIIERSDFITVHTPLTDTTRDLINKDNLTKLKKGARLINCARGGIYNEETLAEGLKSGHLGGVALDVFTKEPVPEGFPLLEHDRCIMTPHLGASTGDAEFAVAMESVDELIEYFESGVARNALNFPTIDPDSMDFLKPYFSGAKSLGLLLAHLNGGEVNRIDIEYSGHIASFMVQPVTTALLAGALSFAMGDDEVNVVNAPVYARDRNIQVNERKSDEARGFSSTVRVTVHGSNNQKTDLEFTAISNECRVYSLAGLPLEFKPEGVILILSNKDETGVIGSIGQFLGENKINIANMELGRKAKGGEALCVLTLDDVLSKETIEAFKQVQHIIDVKQIDLR